MLDLKALNESFDRINLIKTSGKLFEEFTGDESESGIDKEDILDWLSEHEQLWNDCEKHFVQDPTWLSADELESFICDHDQACKDYAKAFGLFFDEEEELDESFGRFLTEAKISPEDKYDSDIIRGIYAKMRQPGRKQFSDEETAIMKKYGLDFSRDNRGRRDNLVLVTKDGDYLPYYGDKDNDKVNYADKARKTPERRQDSRYKRDNPRWNPENQSVRNPKQTWSRQQDDQEMQSDYKDKYNDLYIKRRFINGDKAQLDYQDDLINRYEQQISDLKKQLAFEKKHRDINQDTYDRRKADWKRAIADRRAKKNESLLKKYDHALKQSATLYENFNPSKKSLTEAKKDKILDQLDKEDYQLIKSIYPESTMIIVGHPGNKKVFFIEYEHSGFGGYYHSLRQVFPETKNWNDEGEAYREFFKKIPNWGEPISRKEGQQQEVAYLQSKYDRVLVIPQKKWLQIAQAEVPLDIDDTESKEDEFDPPVKFYYGVYEIDEDNDELDHISDFDTEEEAIKFAKKQSFPTHVVFIPSIDPDDDPEIAEYMQSNAPYEAYEIIWSSLEEDLEEAKEFNFDKLNKKLHGNIRL